MTEPTKSTLDHKCKTPPWFKLSLSERFFIPSQPVFDVQTINRHANFYHYTHPTPSTIEMDWIDMSQPKKVKSFAKSIIKTQDDIKECHNAALLKKLHTKLKLLTTKESKIRENIGKVIKVMSFRIDLTKAQQQIVIQWIGECLNVYNECLQVNTSSLELKDLRKIVFDRLYGNDLKPAPYDMLDDEIRSFLSNRKSALTNLSRNNIKHFELKPRQFKDIMSICIPSTAITASGLFKEKLGSIRDWLKVYNQIKETTQSSTLGWCDSRLVYDRVLNQFFLKVPYYTTPNIPQGREKIIALDPGEKAFMSYYSLNQSGHIGYDIRVPMLKEEKKIRHFDRILKNKVNKQGNKLDKKAIVKIKHKRQLAYRRVRNIVNELHHQTANWLTDHYDRIYIPKFETQKMLKREEYIKGKKAVKKFNRLNKRYKFTLQNLAHYRFRQHLMYKGMEKGCKIEIVTEEYTSQCCGACGRLSKEYDKNRVKKCKCGCNVDRDLNGARNILLKRLNE
jgi:putative transposase